MNDIISCLIIDIIRNTLTICNYQNCNHNCSQYLLDVAGNCSSIFNNQQYLELWNTLINICFTEGH